MYRSKKIYLVCFIAAVMAASGCGSSGGEKDSSSKNTKTASADASQAESSEDSAGDETAETTAAESAQPETESVYQPGELLENAAKLFDGAYTYELDITYSDEPEAVTHRSQVSDGTNVFVEILRPGTETIGSDTAYILYSDHAVSLDKNVGAYSAAEQETELCIVKSVIERQLERTYNHIPEDTEGLSVEEYTYTGDTFITVYDFYFDEEGGLVKYTASYNTEGDDPLIETAEVVTLSTEGDGMYFEEDFLREYRDFDGMTEDERLGFCQELCGKYSISTDNMYTLGITTDDFKRISLDELGELMYKFAKPAEDSESSASDKKKKEDSSSGEKKGSEKSEDSSAEEDSTAEEDKDSSTEQ